MATDTTNIQSETVNSTVAHEGDVDRVTLTQGATQVQVPQGENVVRVQVTPGETIQLPFGQDQMIARLDDGNGNLAVKVGDITVILQGYIAAAGEAEVNLIDANGQPVDVAAVVAATDPNLDIQTAAGPGAGDQGAGVDNNGGVFSPFDPAAGIGGLNAIGGLQATALQYGLIERQAIVFEVEEEGEVDTTPVVVSITQAPPVNEDDLNGSQHARDLIDRLTPKEEEPSVDSPSFRSFSESEGGDQGPKWVLGKPYEDGNDPFDTEDHEDGSQTDTWFGSPADGKSAFDPLISDDGPWDDVDRDREPLSVTGIVEANFFADLPGKMVFDANGDGINDGLGDVPLIEALEARGLTSHGHELTYALLPAIPESAPGANDGTGQMVVAFYADIKHGCPTNVVVFTIGIDDDVVNAGETNLLGNAEFGVTFNLYGVIDHPENPNGSTEEGNGIEDILGIEVPFFLQDSDSPPVPSTWPEPLKFDVIDDIPFLGEVCYVTLCGFDVPIAITKANLTIGHDESKGEQDTWYDSKLQPNGPDWLPDQKTDDVGGAPAWYLINKADDQLDGIASGEASGEDTDLGYQQDILSLLSEDYLNNGNFCADALGVAKTYLDVSFGADGKARGNDQAGSTIFNKDNDKGTGTDDSQKSYDQHGNLIGNDDGGTDKRAFELFMKNTGPAGEENPTSGQVMNWSDTSWTVSFERPDGSIQILVVRAFQLDANTIIGMASPSGFEGGEPEPEQNGGKLQGALYNDGGEYGLDGEGDGIPVFMLRLDPDSGQLVFVQYHQINNPQGGDAKHPDWDNSANDPIHLYDADGNQLVFFQATDFDGDTVTSALEVSVIDDAPKNVTVQYENEGERGYVDEDFLTAGTNGVDGNKDKDTNPDNTNKNGAPYANGDGPGDTKVTGKILADFGVDKPGKFSFNIAGLTVGGDAIDSGLNSADGDNVMYRLVNVDGNVRLEAFNAADDSLVFTVFLNTNTGDFCFDLLAALEHPDNDGNSKNNSKDDGTDRYEDDLKIEIGVRATDVDGDYRNATLDIRVDDDAPRLVCPPETVSIQNGECPVCQTEVTQGENLVVSPENDCLSEETCMVTIKPGEDYAGWLKLSVLVLDEEGLDEPNKNDDDLFVGKGLGFGVLSGEDGGNGGRFDEINYDHTANNGQGASETLIFKIGTEACPQLALSGTVQLSRFYSNEGNVGNEQGRWEAYKDGVKVGEGDFTANNTNGQFGLAIPTIPGGFNELRFTATAGTLNPQGNSDDSDYYVQALNLEIQPVHMLQGQFKYTFGADNGDPAAVTVLYKGEALTSGGKPVVMTSTTDENGVTTILGFKDVDGNGADEGDLPLFKMVVDPSDSVNGNVHTAKYTFTQYGPLDNDPDGSTLPFEVKIQDNDKDAITTSIDICINDSAPETDTTCATVYEKGLNQDGSAKDGTDKDANSEYAHGFLNFSYNGDGPGSITEVKQTNGGPVAALIGGLWVIDVPQYKLTVDAITGEYNFTLKQNLDHDDSKDDGFNNREGVNGTIHVGDILKELGFEYTVKDGDGSTATGGLTVKVVDDGPILCVDVDHDGSVSIDESAGNQRDDRNNSETPAALVAIATAAGLNVIEYAKDGDSIVDVDVDFGADGGSLNVTIGTPANGTDSGLDYKGTDGNTQNILLYNEGGIVVGRVSGGPENGKPVFAIQIDQDGELAVAQYLPIKHPNTNDDDDYRDINTNALVVTVTATDGDGDKAVKSVNIGDKVKFYDDGPSIGRDVTHTLDEDEIPGAGGNPGGPGDAKAPYTVSGDLDIDFGTDGPGTVTIQLLDPSPKLSSTGETLQWQQVGDTLIGFTGDINNAANHAMTVKVESDGDYTVTLLKALKHADGGGENDIDDLDFRVTVTDKDGDSETANIAIVIDDDTPTAKDDGILVITDLGAAQTGTNLLLNDSVGADKPGRITAVKLGANWYSVEQDADGSTFKINADGSKDGNNDYVGKLTVDKNGNWSFEQTQSSDANDITFEYKLLDADNDLVTAKFKVDLLERVNYEPSISSTNGEVDEDFLTKATNGVNGNQDGDQDPNNPGVQASPQDGGGAASANGTYTVDFHGEGGSVAFAAVDGVDTGMDTLDGVNIVWNRVSDTEIQGHRAGDESDVYFTMTLDSTSGSGNWEFDLLKAVKHAENSNEDAQDPSVSVDIVATDGFGGDKGSTTVKITIDDDMPIVTNDSVTLDENSSTGGQANVMFILDVTRSMNTVDPGNTKTRLELAKEAITAAALKYFNDAGGDGNIKFQLATFGATGVVHGATWMDYNAFIAAVAGATTISSTNYDVGLLTGMDAFDNPGAIPGATNVSFFVSDGEPNQGSPADGKNENGPSVGTGGDSGIGAGEEQIWKDFLEANDILSYAIGIGPNATTGSALQELAPIAYDGRPGGALTDNDLVLSVADVADLETVLGGIGGVVETGNLLANDFPGADNWASVAIGSVRFGEMVGTPDDNGVIVIQTSAGTLTVYTTDYDGHKAGDYKFEAGEVAADTTVTFSYTAVDRDGDGVDGTLTVTVENANAAPVITSGDSASVPENTPTTTVVYDIDATDADGNPITYSISGADADLFNVNTSGKITFKNVPDFENPADKGGNNVYDIVVHANDGMTTTNKNVTITVTDVNENTPPSAVADNIITSNSGTFIVQDAWLLRNDTDTETPNDLKIVGVTAGAGQSTYFDSLSHSGSTVSIDLDTGGGKGELTSGSSTNFDYTVEDPSAASGTANAAVKYVNSTTLTGTDNADIIIGDGSDETLNGGKGHDILVGGDGEDTLNGGSGDDWLIYDSEDTFDGGSDFDTLKVLSAIDLNVDDDSGSNDFVNRVNNIEAIDLRNGSTSDDFGNESGGGGNADNALSAGDVLNMTDADGVLYILGDGNGAAAGADDQVRLGGNWTVGSTFTANDPSNSVINGVQFTTYTNGGATVHIQTTMEVENNA